MRVAMTLPTFEIGGMERFQLSLARELSSRGHSVVVLGVRGGGPLESAFAECTERVEILRGAGPGPLGLWWPGALAQAVRRFGADVVHSVSGVWLPSSRAAQLAGRIGMVQAQHGLEPRLAWRDLGVLRLAARRTHAVVAVSEEVAVQTASITRLSKVPEVIANGLLLPALRPGVDRVSRARWGIPRDAFLLGCLARFDPVKNLPLLLRGVAAAHAARPALNVHLVLAGDGPERPALERLVRDLGLGTRVHLVGMLPDPAALLGALDACVLTSTTEGTPMSLIEAMALGVPVASTSVGGVPALLSRGAAGRLFPSDDEAALVEVLLTLADDANGNRSRVAAARAQVEGTYAIGAVSSRYEQVYRSAVTSARGRSH